MCTSGASVGEEDHVRPVLDGTSGAPVARLAGGDLIVDSNNNVEEGHVYGYCPGAQFLV
ncbi:hypothetical protein [Halomonas lysinitropha]|uniref:hypothetical protein n=1 Tax=Halomonas lysinitropha TaxID=2607506 RepID=UPI003B438D0A